jgi:hypothetical protein
MQARLFAGLLLCSLFFAVGGDAQSPDPSEKPVWTLEFIKVRPEKYGPALGYLDDHWMRVREEAKRQGAVLTYHRFSDAMLAIPGPKSNEKMSIVLLTEYKNFATFLGREKLFASIAENLPSSTPGVFPHDAKPEDLYEVEDSRVFHEEPAMPDTGFRLLAKQ